MYSKIHIFFNKRMVILILNTAASKCFEGNLKEFLLYFEGNFDQKKEKIRKFPIL